MYKSKKKGILNTHKKKKRVQGEREAVGAPQFNRKPGEKVTRRKCRKEHSQSLYREPSQLFPPPLSLCIHGRK